MPFHSNLALDSLAAFYFFEPFFSLMNNPLDRAIIERRTCKVFASNALDGRSDALSKTSIEELIKIAGLAPFHRACDECHRTDGSSLTGIEPWRVHSLDAASCRNLIEHLPEEGAGKIPRMLNAADALLMVTWLPNPSSSDHNTQSLFEPTLGNMEHIAAASAAIQNLLLVATDRGIENYWSSGGVLRQPELFQHLGIPTCEILLGAIFLFPPESADLPLERAYSKLRPNRTSPAAWSRWVQL